MACSVVRNVLISVKSRLMRKTRNPSKGLPVGGATYLEVWNIENGSWTDRQKPRRRLGFNSNEDKTAWDNLSIHYTGFTLVQPCY